MRVLHVLSYPALAAGETGGILRVFRSYAQMARSLGFEVDLYSPGSNLELASADLVHLAPCDLTTYGIGRLLRDKHIPFVVSPILDKTYANWALRLVTLGDQLAGRLYHSHLGAAKEICSWASGVCLMSSHEGGRVIQGLGLHPNVMQVVQPVTPCEIGSVNTSLFRRLHGDAEFVLFVGDLSNPRKNVLRLLRATSESSLPLVLIGPLSDTSYGKHVQRAIERASGVSYLGMIPRQGLSRDILLSAMASCRVFALPSLMEGIGMAAIEAGSLGAKIVITKNGGPIDYFERLAWYVDPYSVKSIANGLAKAWNSEDTPPLAVFLRERLSLSALAPKLGSLYTSALTSNPLS